MSWAPPPVRTRGWREEAGSAAPAAGWLARIELELAPRGPRTVLARRAHVGPLAVQSPFYPEGGVCHVYLLHPPGGMAGGDRIEVEITAHAGAQALVTTPAAGKVYRGAGRGAAQRQRLAVAAGAALEWLPQESIAFAGADAALATRVELARGARYLGWEVLCLGRPAAGEAFSHGRLRAGLDLWRAGRPVLVERAAYEGGSALLREPWGLAGHAAVGTLVATPGDADALAAVREALAREATAAASRVDDVVVVRCLGARADRVRAVLERAWAALRPVVLGRVACAPRIWAT